MITQLIHQGSSACVTNTYISAVCPQPRICCPSQEDIQFPLYFLACLVGILYCRTYTRILCTWGARHARLPWECHREVAHLLFLSCGRAELLLFLHTQLLIPRGGRFCEREVLKCSVRPWSWDSATGWTVLQWGWSAHRGTHWRNCPSGEQKEWGTVLPPEPRSAGGDGQRAHWNASSPEKQRDRISELQRSLKDSDANCHYVSRQSYTFKAEKQHFLVLVNKLFLWRWKLQRRLRRDSSSDIALELTSSACAALFPSRLLHVPRDRITLQRALQDGGKDLTCRTVVLRRILILNDLISIRCSNYLFWHQKNSYSGSSDLEIQGLQQNRKRIFKQAAFHE